MIRKATIKDVRKIYDLVNYYAKKEEMLPRSLSELYENLRDFYVFEEKKKVYGCGALHIVWDNLAEIKSLAVGNNRQRKGIGSKILEACLAEARKLKVTRIFVLTFKPGFFMRHGFKLVDKSELPQKVWGECIKCQYFPDCDEIALAIDLK